ncbi:MAG TPA: TolC family protein [Phycisphaerae bacterium]|nr:TolC family protein [Phycisphaerae bacterium]
MRLVAAETLILLGLFGSLGGCALLKQEPPAAAAPDVRPTSQPSPANSVELDKSLIRPMHQELLPIDLPATARVALANNLDIQLARQQVKAQRGRLESTVGAVFPVVGPNTSFEHLDGTTRHANGALFGANFNTFRATAAAELITNPGRVVYDIIAARKTLSASKHQERYVILETLRLAANQYYDLALAQADVAAARQAVVEAEELLRINQLRLDTGMGIPADVVMAKAQVSERQEQFIASIDDFYRASVALAVTLRLDAAVTLIPKADQFSAVTLVRPDLPLDDLLALAVMYRPDLDRVRALAEAAAAQTGATWWGDLGPEFQVGYEYGGVTGHSNHTIPGKGIPPPLVVNPFSTTGTFSTVPLVNGAIVEGISEGSQNLAPSRNQTFGFSGEEHFTAGAGSKWSLSAIGDLKTANAEERSAVLSAELRLEQVKGQVVSILQESRTQLELITASQQEVAFATEALRLSQVNLQAGTMITLDVLHAEDAVARARVHYASAVARYNQAQVNLLASIGLLAPGVFTESSHAALASENPPGEKAADEQPANVTAN